MGLVKSKIHFYQSMATMTEAGVSIVQALRQKHPRPFNSVGPTMANTIENGEGNFNELMNRYPSTFTSLECQLVAVGEQTGRLDTVFRSLSEWYQLRRRLTSQIISDMIYPVVLYHFASVIIPFISFFIDKGRTIPSVIIEIIFFLSPFYLILVLSQLQNLAGKIFHIQLPSFLGSIFLYIPLLGVVIRKLNYSRFFHAFSIAVEAGIMVPESTRLGANACSNSYIRTTFINVANSVETHGGKFSEAFKEYIFPADRESMAVTVMETGELSGKIDETAKHIAKIYQQESEESLKLLASIIPKIIYFGLVLFIAYTIISFWTRIFSQTTQLL